MLAAVLGGAYLAAPRMGSDLAAQVARAEFFAAHGWTPIDLRWYAGVDQLGYSLVSQPVMTLLGVRVAGVVASVTGSVLLLQLFRRTGGRRLWLAGLLGVVGVGGNLVSGRVTYGLGVCLGLAALLALTYLPRRSAAFAAALLAALASATSPVVALFLGLAGTALLLSSWPWWPFPPPRKGHQDQPDTPGWHPQPLPRPAKGHQDQPDTPGWHSEPFPGPGKGHQDQPDTPGWHPRPLPRADKGHHDQPDTPGWHSEPFPGPGKGHQDQPDTPGWHPRPLPRADKGHHDQPDTPGWHPRPLPRADKGHQDQPDNPGWHSEPFPGAGRGHRDQPGVRVLGGLLIAAPAAGLIGLNALLFGDGGWMNISRTDTLHAVLTGLLVAALVPVRPVRIGALLSSAGVLAAALVHTPVGLNATRLAVMFALPVLAAYAKLPDRLGKRTVTAGITAILALTAWWQPPVVPADLRDIGNPAADPAYFRPLTDRLAAETLTGRVEIPPTRAYWEAARLGDVPLARGWLRQADIDRNPIFFTTVPGAAGTGVPLSAGTYRLWLAEQAVQFVAVPDTELSWSGRAEAELVTAGLPYLTPVWSDAHWRLYAVAAPQPIVAAPATLVRHTAAALTVDAPAGGDIRLRVRWYRWLHASDGAEVIRDGDWTILRVPGPGRYELTS
ncbi:hypothetical protein GCM10010168_69610 [Actinoplanes ianthinogenes]|uniref:Integral membrane protein n=1 Tax=Actinoplanes ianthinogenes TaxID=122358 RepID=A0ABM7M0P1_9ACTN|nr:hypothetical protein Aiant_58170 [Actinoplanes ianthinogenes]GGR40975.1 hypothetical protein GCM10010168_69610 [Actinoplanes ianthinogenes]